MDRRRNPFGDATDEAVEAALSLHGYRTVSACAWGGSTMQPECVALMSPDSASEETFQRTFERTFAGLIGEQQFDHWFRDKTELLLVDTELIVRAISPFLLKWLKKQFKASLSKALEQVVGPAARLRFESGAATRRTVSDDQPVAFRTAAAVLPSAESPIVLPCQPNEIAISTRKPASSLAVSPERSPRPTGRRFADLSEFVSGPCNELALTAVRQVCSRPDGVIGPLVLYGTVGTGKTHLLEGMHRFFRRTYTERRILFLTSEQFTNYFTQALRDRTLPAFRQKFRSVDILLVDDVDFFEGKRAVQEEFLHTYKQLDGLGKLVIVSADRHPRLMTKLTDELRTRFLSGMVCRLESPDLETRERIVFLKAEKLDADFSAEALRYVAQRFAGSVRELEGALNSLHVYQKLTGKCVGVSAARQALSDLERDCLRVVRLADIERVVCNQFGVEAEDLRSSSRTRAFSEPRMLAMYLARRHTRSAYSEIGKYFGGRNHATVIAAERKIIGWLRNGTSVRIASRTCRLSDILESLEHQLQAG